MRWLLALALLGACRDFAAPGDAQPYDPPPEFQALWDRMASCAGVHADLGRVHWFTTQGPLELDGKSKAGVWSSPHTIYMLDSYIVDAYRDYVAVRHEMLHDLLQTGEHGPLFTQCDALNLN